LQRNYTQIRKQRPITTISAFPERCLTEEEQFRLKQLNAQFAKENTNFFFAITDRSGTVLLSNYEGEDYGLLKTYRYEEHGGIIPDPSYAVALSPENETPDEIYFVNCYVRDPIEAADDYYTPYRIFQAFNSLRYVLIPLSVLSALSAVALFVFLLRAAGTKKGRKKSCSQASTDCRLICMLRELSYLGLFWPASFRTCSTSPTGCCRPRR
jgi:hypothetical protein